MKIWIYLIFLFILPFFACVHTKVEGGNVHKRYTDYGIQLPNKNWIQKPFKHADLFFEHQSKTAQIFFSAECEKFSDSPLVALTAQILADFSDVKTFSQTWVELSKRKALVTSVAAKLDGVDRYLKIMVLRKNRCVYDAVLSMPHADDEKEKDFDELIKSFWARATL